MQAIAGRVLAYICIQDCRLLVLPWPKVNLGQPASYCVQGCTSVASNVSILYALARRRVSITYS